MADEYNALMNNHTWKLVPLPPNKNIIGSKRVYRVKLKSDGTLARYKARLVAQVYCQQAGCDYDETYSLVVKPVTIRVILSIAISKGWHVHQLDVKNAFLHGILQEEVYMRQPPGFVHPDFPHHVCRLNKAIYGLKQAPRAWFQRFQTFIFSIGFRGSAADSSMFIFNNPEDSSLLEDPTTYRSIVGALQYLTFTRPDISFTFHQVCQFLSTPSESHLLAVKRILRYLKGTANYGLQLCTDSIDHLTAYCDADWAVYPDTRRSTSDYCVYLGSNFISWSAKKQPTVSRSSAEA